MRFLLFTFLVFLLTNATITCAQPHDQLSGSLEVVPDDSFVVANLTYRYVPRSSADTAAIFYLPRTVTITSLESPNGNRYQEIVDTTTYVGKLFKTLVVSLDTPVQQPVDIKMQYEGTVDLHTFSGISLPDRWIEISPNTVMVTPLPTDFAVATVDLLVKSPDEYALVGVGETTSEGPGKTRLRSAEPLRGVYFVLGKDLVVEAYPYEGDTVTLASSGASDSLKQIVARRIGWTVDFYNRTFGQRQPKQNVTVTLRPYADWDASFAAGTNYFATYDSGPAFFKNEPFYVGTYAHEIAHFWWMDADASTADNWLNESLSEYCALLAIKAQYGDSVFQQKIKEHRAKAEAVPDSITLTNYERYGEYDQAMAYSVGTLVLHTIYQNAGEEAFYQLLRKMDTQPVNTTQQFISLVEDRFGNEPWLEEVSKHLTK